MSDENKADNSLQNEIDNSVSKDVKEEPVEYGAESTHSLKKTDKIDNNSDSKTKHAEFFDEKKLSLDDFRRLDLINLRRKNFDIEEYCLYKDLVNFNKIKSPTAILAIELSENKNPIIIKRSSLRLDAIIHAEMLEIYNDQLVKPEETKEVSA